MEVPPEVRCDELRSNFQHLLSLDCPETEKPRSSTRMGSLRPHGALTYRGRVSMVSCYQPAPLPFYCSPSISFVCTSPASVSTEVVFIISSSSASVSASPISSFL